MFKRLVSIALLLALLFPLAAVQADTAGGAQYCGSLAESDCQLLLGNIETMDEVYSFAFSMAMTFDVDAADPAADMSLTGTGGGAFSMDAALARQVSAQLDSAAAEAMAAAFETALTNVTGEMWLELDIESAWEADEFAMQLRMKDGVLLMSASAMEALMEENMGGMEWFGLDFTGASDMLMSELGVDVLAEQPPAMTEEMQQALDDAVMISRLPDSEVNGSAVAVFETSGELAAMIAYLEHADMAASGADANETTVALDMLRDITVQEDVQREYIGLDDGYTHRHELVLAAILKEGEAGETSLNLSMDIELKAFNQPVEVEIPEDAFAIPLGMMMQMQN